MWVFGYGSLIWRPDLPYDARVEGYIQGWCRKFYQGSTDHRGVPGAPGRVVTMVPEEGARTHGVAFHIPDTQRELVLDRLDHREQGGYVRQDLIMTRVDDGHAVPVLVYCALPGNPEYLGEASVQEIATQIFGSHGPSGPNTEYVLELEVALRAMLIDDPHTFAISAHLRRMLADDLA